MERFKDVNLISCIAIMVIFTFVYFFAVNKISYAFEYDYDIESSHKNKISVIEECAKKYGEINKNDFEKDTMYIKVSDLIESELIATNHEGNVVDNYNGKILNDNVIKIKYENDEYSVEVSV